jgi:hypothetical protein
MKRFNIKKFFGFESQYSWMKWLKISFAVVALVIALIFFSYFGFLILDMGIFGLIIGLIIFLMLLGPLLLIMLGVASLLGIIIGGTLSGKKQYKSFKETEATGSGELMVVEKLRIKSQILDFLFFLSIIALFALYFPFVDPLYDAFGETGLYAYFILAGIIVIVFWFAKLPTKIRYKNAFKEEVVKRSLSLVLDNMDFRANEKLDEAIVNASGLFPKYDVYNGNDYLIADYHGHHFMQSDVRLQEMKEESYWDDGELKTRTVYVDVFNGRFMVFNYDALSNEPVSVYDRCGKKPKNNENFKTELDLFNQNFYINSTSAEAALRILTPPVLEGIVLARGKIGYPLHLSFKDDKLYIALANGDSFEAAGGDTTLSEQRQRVTKDIQAILELIDTLYLKVEKIEK